MGKTVVIVDTYWSGHHPTYFKLFCSIALAHGHRVIALSPASSELSNWKNEKLFSVDQFRVFKCNEVTPIHAPVKLIGTYLTVCKRWNNVKQTLRDIRSHCKWVPDLVFFPWVDSYLSPLLTPYFLERFFPFSWAGLYFHPYHLRIKKENILKQKIIGATDRIFKSGNCKAIAILDEGIFRLLQDRIENKPVIVFPDVADDSAPDFNFNLIDQIRSRANGRKIVVLLGSIAKRKGILTLLNAALDNPTKDYFYVFIGRLAKNTFLPDEQRLLKKLASIPPDNCFFSFKKIPDESKFNALVAISDVVFACYDHFPHSSNILTKIAIFKKPIIVSNRYCMGERVRKFSLGLAIEEGDVSGCIDAIRKITEVSSIIDDDCFEVYKNNHSFSKLSNMFEELVTQ